MRSSARPCVSFGVVWFVALTCAWTLLPAGSVRAQQPGWPQMETFTADGTIQAVGPGKIQMLTNTNQSWVVMIPAKSNVHVRGTAAAAYLRPGQFVRFKAKLDAQGHAQGTLDELTIFVPEKPDQIGVQQEEGVAAPGGPALGVGGRPPRAATGPPGVGF